MITIDGHATLHQRKVLRYFHDENLDKQRKGKKKLTFPLISRTVSVQRFSPFLDITRSHHRPFGNGSHQENKAVEVNSVAQHAANRVTLKPRYTYAQARKTQGAKQNTNLQRVELAEHIDMKVAQLLPQLLPQGGDMAGQDLLQNRSVVQGASTTFQK